MNERVCAYLQVYKSIEPVRETIKSFRSAFPNSHIYLVSDKGIAFDEIQGEFSNVGRYYGNTNMGLGTIDWDKFLVFAARLHRYFQYCKTCNANWGFFLEDDVRFNRGFYLPTVDKPSAFGQTRNTLCSEMADALKEINPNLHGGTLVGGSGGTYFNLERLTSLSYEDFFDHLTKVFKPLYDRSSDLDPCLQHRMKHIDYVLSVILLAFGYEYRTAANLGQFGEVPTDVVDIIHGVKI